MAKRLRSDYEQLDLCVQARTLYDHTGMIKEGGRIQSYEYEAPKATVTSSVLFPFSKYEWDLRVSRGYEYGQDRLRWNLGILQQYGDDT